MFRRFALALLALLPLGQPAAAWQAADAVQIAILPGWRGEGGVQVAALRITLAAGWKTYWRAPGDAGIPPRFDFAASRNIANVRPVWPVPEIDFQNGLRSLVFHDELVLPLMVQMRGPGLARLAGTVEIGVCEEICVPVTLSFAADLPEGGGRDGVIVAALADRPLTPQEAGVRAATCRVQPGETGLRIEARVVMPQLGAGEAAAIEAGDPSIWVSEPDVLRAGNSVTITADMVAANGRAIAIDRSALRITLFGGGNAVEIAGCPAP